MELRLSGSRWALTDATRVKAEVEPPKTGTDARNDKTLLCAFFNL